MPKKSKQELIDSIEAMNLSDDEKITLMEDIADSIEDNSEEVESLKSALDSANKDIELWKEKYKDRFMSKEEIKEIKEEEPEEPEKEEEKEYIDVKEI